MTYRIRQQEIWDTYTLIEAGSEAEAIAKVLDGQGDQVSSEFNRMGDFKAEVE
jgi:hypothetical protein